MNPFARGNAPAASSMFVASTVIAASALFLGCGVAMGPHVRVATATAQELEAAGDKNEVWYEFQPGDEVPVSFAFFGAVEGGDEHAAFRAKQHFFFVMRKGLPMQISFDGKSFASDQSSQTIVAIVPRKEGNGGRIGWLLYMGESGEPEAELKKLIEENKKGGDDKGGDAKDDGASDSKSDKSDKK